MILIAESSSVQNFTVILMFIFNIKYKRKYLQYNSLSVKRQWRSRFWTFLFIYLFVLLQDLFIHLCYCLLYVFLLWLYIWFLFVLGFIYSLIVISGRFELEFKQVFVSPDLKFKMAFTFLWKLFSEFFF